MLFFVPAICIAQPLTKPPAHQLLFLKNKIWRMIVAVSSIIAKSCIMHENTVKIEKNRMHDNNFVQPIQCQQSIWEKYERIYGPIKVTNKSLHKFVSQILHLVKNVHKKCCINFSHNSYTKYMHTDMHIHNFRYLLGTTCLFEISTQLSYN